MLKPTKENVLVRYVKGEEVTKSGIVLPNSKPSMDAEVLAVGPWVDIVSVGDKVLINREAKPTNTNDDNEFVVAEDDIVGIYE